MSFGIYKGKGRGLQSDSTQPVSMFSARVKAIILDSETYPEIYEANGKEAALGGITFERLILPSSNQSSLGSSFALPLLPNINHYPIEQELVTILSVGGLNTNISTANTTFYYLPPINSWTSTHINAVPNEVSSTDSSPDSQKKSYIEVNEGSTSKASPTFSNTLLFKYGIKERRDIRPLLPQPGDVSLEGRWGQSIRLGSTNRSAIKNTWSSVGSEGDPLIIIRNNQYQDSAKPWIPLSEDINKDGSSIYFTSTQKINISTKNFKTTSFSQNPPTFPSEYTDNQIILASDRLLFSSNKDSVLITSGQDIHCSSLNFNIDCSNSVISAKKINLGGKDNIQPVLKGDDTVDTLNKLLIQLTSFMTVVAATSLPGISESAKLILPELSNIQIKINTQLRSNTTFTK